MKNIPHIEAVDINDKNKIFVQVKYNKLTNYFNFNNLFSVYLCIKLNINEDIIHLDCVNKSIKNIKLINCQNVHVLTLQHNSIKSLNISNMKKLAQLSCDNYLIDFNDPLLSSINFVNLYI